MAMPMEFNADALEILHSFLHFGETTRQHFADLIDCLS
jgi:hypothetical protein